MDMSFQFPGKDAEPDAVAAPLPDWFADRDFLWLVAELHAELSEQKRLQLSC
jgi:hypothetical protein